MEGNAVAAVVTAATDAVGVYVDRALIKRFNECEPVFLVCDGSSGSPELERAIAEKFAAAFEVWKARQRKYGPGNIARRGPAGVMVRIDDKLARLDRAFAGIDTESADETVADSCVDVANYALIALLCHEGKWPGWPHP